MNFISYFSSFLIVFSIRRFYKSIFIYACVSGKGRDKTDVLTFRGFDRAHSAVVSVVNVTNFEACSFAAETARAQSGKLTFVRKFGDRVRLIHKLGQLAASEKFLDGGADGTDVHCLCGVPEHR